VRVRKKGRGEETRKDRDLIREIKAIQKENQGEHEQKNNKEGGGSRKLTSYQGGGLYSLFKNGLGVRLNAGGKKRKKAKRKNFVICNLT